MLIAGSFFPDVAPIKASAADTFAFSLPGIQYCNLEWKLFTICIEYFRKIDIIL